MPSSRAPARGTAAARLFAVLAALGLGLGLSAAFAQSALPAPIHVEAGHVTLETLGHRFEIPMPDWLAASDAGSLDAVEALFAADARQALLEIVPRGATPRDSDTVYAARITLEPDRALSEYRTTIMLGYAQTCQASLAGFFQLGEDQGDTLAPLGFVCGAFLDRVEGLAGRGQVMIMAFKRTERGIATVYQEWRGRAFDPTNPAAWPVPTGDVEARARQFQNEALLSVASE